MGAAATPAGRSGIVLAGGRSSRLGRPKALLDLEGEPLVCRVVGCLLDACADVVVVLAPRGGRDGDEIEALERALERFARGDRNAPPAGSGSRGSARPDAEARLRLAHDDLLDRGPVAGLAAGLAAVRGERAFVAACDAPFLAPALVSGLFAIAEAAPETDVVIPRTAGGLEPMVAVYRVATMAPHYARQLADGELRPTRRLAERSVREVDEAALRALDPALESFVGVNDEAEYRAARERALRRADRTPGAR